jgi:hypothetical protein
VTWIESDVTGAWSLKPMDIWHDRAVFHFLVEAEDRLRYLTHLRQTLKVNGGAIIATFAPTARTDAAVCPWHATRPTRSPLNWAMSSHCWSRDCINTAHHPARCSRFSIHASSGVTSCSAEWNVDTDALALFGFAF